MLWSASTVEKDEGREKGYNFAVGDEGVEDTTSVVMSSRAAKKAAKKAATRADKQRRKQQRQQLRRERADYLARARGKRPTPPLKR